MVIQDAFGLLMIWFRYRGTFLAATRGAVCGCGTPKGLHLSAQGCGTRLPWGWCRANAQSIVDDNPEGVVATVPSRHVRLFIIRIARRNHVGVGSGNICPKVAQYANLGL